MNSFNSLGSAKPPTMQTPGSLIIPIEANAKNHQILAVTSTNQALYPKEPSTS